MQADPGVLRQDADGVGRLRAPLGVDGVVRQPRGACHVRPGQDARASHARLIAVQDRRLLQRRLDGGFDRLQRRGPLLHPLDEGPQRELHPQQIGEELAHAAVGHQLLLHQIDDQRPQPRAVLRATGRHGRKAPAGHLLAMRAAHMQGLVLPHDQAQPGEFVDLPPLAQHDGRVV